VESNAQVFDFELSDQVPYIILWQHLHDHPQVRCRIWM
jgi:hypothetical protein